MVNLRKINFYVITYVRTQVVGDAEAPLDPKDLQTSAAPVNCVLCDQVAQGTKNEAHVPKNHEAHKSSYWEKRVHLVLHECHNLHYALVAGYFLRAVMDK